MAHRLARSMTSSLVQFYTPSGAALPATMQGAEGAVCPRGKTRLRRRRIEKAQTPRAFCPGLYKSFLGAETMGRAFLLASEIASTQTAVHGALDALDDGFACLADVQTSGKGRGGNTWTSPLGCPMCTFVTSFSDGTTLPFVQYLVSLAIVRAVRTMEQGTADARAQVRIKWPTRYILRQVCKDRGGAVPVDVRRWHLRRRRRDLTWRMMSRPSASALILGAACPANVSSLLYSTNLSPSAPRSLLRVFRPLCRRVSRRVAAHAPARRRCNRRRQSACV